ncbi:MAG: UDP-3-O-(3-hydroxymyristoyl)glucosamine N-acyltransferase [Verrucomicrobiota bacterium JB023]|nr:UDP-3-O-(3-hydroxymyristoyl)glucosamine N-acyltransferase [Verrucomicrobiota bacterium JB023]
MEISVSQIVDIVSGRLVRGDGNRVLNGMASLDEAATGDLSFLGNERYLQSFLKTQAGAVLAPAGAPEPDGDVAVIEVENPSLAFSQVLEASLPKRPFEAGIHPRAFVDESACVDGAMIRAGAVVEAGAIVGAGTEVGPNVVIERGARVGSDCLLHGNSSIRENCILGDRVVLQPGAVIGSEGYGYEFVDGRHRPIPQMGIVVLEDDVEVGANTTIDRARFGKTVIGEGTKIDNLVQIAHNVTTGKHCLIVAQTGIAGSSSLGNYVTLAAQCGVAGHLKIADQAVLASRSGVAKSIPEKGVYWGAPAVPIREEQRRLVHSSKLAAMAAELKALRKKVEAMDS